MPISNLQLVTAVFTLIFGVMAVSNVIFPPDKTGRVGDAQARPAAAAAPNVAQPAPAPPAAPVDSWKKFVETAKSRIAAAKEQWSAKHPDSTLGLTIVKDDVKKSNSLKSPLIGEITCISRSDWDETEQRDREIFNLKKRLQLAVATNATQSVKEINAELSDARKKSDYRRYQWEFNLTFSPEGQSWVLTSGEAKKTEDNRSPENVGKVNKFDQLTEEWMITLFK